MNLTPEWALAAYERLVSARRDISPEERAEALKDGERSQQRATILRRLERVA